MVVSRKITDFDEDLNLERLEKIQEIKIKRKSYFDGDIAWSNAILMPVYHVITLWIFFSFPYIQKWRTALFFFFYSIISLVGVMAFGHRYCSHRSFKANTPLKLLMMMMYGASGSYSAYTWAIDHRVHHKYTDTMADPYNAKRGFFFSHMGWLMLRKSPEYHRRAANIDMSDFKNDPLLMHFENNYRMYYLIFVFLLPTFITCYFWKETFFHAVTFNLARVVLNMNCVWCINSFSHHFGYKPYDKNSTAAESLFVTIVSCGEGWHNYHHKFPWDYRAGLPGQINLAANFIDLFAKLGWAYDLREASPELVKKVMMKNLKQMEIENNNNNVEEKVF